MERLNTLWKKWTPTKALEQSSGVHETAFYESLYRITYVAGLSSLDRDLSYLIYSTTVKTITVLTVVGELWYLFSEPLNLDEFVGCLNVIIIYLITLYKLMNLMNHKNIYMKLARSMQSPYFDTTPNRRKNLVEFWVQRHERYLKLLLALGNITLAAWYMYPLVDELEYNLMVGVTLPFTYNTPVRYIFTYVLVGIPFYYASLYVMVIDLTMQSHLLPLICQYTVLADCFENLLTDCEVGLEDVDRNNLFSNEEFIKRCVKRLSNLVDQHKFILNHSMELRTILSGPILGQLAASGILICFVGYQATTTIAENITKFLMSLFYLGYNMFTLYIICRWCEEITIQSQNIGEAIYSSGWEGGMSVVSGVRSTILLVISRANSPLVFTAGGMYNLSLTSYTSLVKTSYSALTFLLRIRRE